MEYQPMQTINSIQERSFLLGIIAQVADNLSNSIVVLLLHQTVVVFTRGTATRKANPYSLAIVDETHLLDAHTMDLKGGKKFNVQTFSASRPHLNTCPTPKSRYQATKPESETK